MDSMTSRQRFLAAVAGLPTDRAPARFNAFGPGPEPAKVARHLGIPLDGEWLIPLHERLRVDTVKFEAYLNPDIIALDIPESGDPWEGLERLNQVDRRWSELRRNPDCYNFEHVPALLETWDATGNPPAVQISLAVMFGMVRSLRGDAQAMMDMMDEHEIMTHIMDTMEAFILGLIDKAYALFGDRIDMFHVAEELGMQTGLMYPPDAIRRILFPSFRRIFERIHSCGALVFFHSCGAIDPLIPELIDLGVDILNPIQPYVPGMDPDHLGAAYGDKLCFCGGMDMQRLMPFGTPAEIQAEVRRYIDCLRPRYILDYANILHADIPVENTLALYDAPR